MKKMILGGIAAIVIAALAAVNVNMNSQSENLLSDLALANVEALGSEIGAACGGCSTSCAGNHCCVIEIGGMYFDFCRCSIMF
ncbi:MAG: NVEALA domain-containing protein [Tannerella sp.]|jgi:hypothetical protein|nr:NVEALA domain-containing protein [Tannerella sp.]